MTSQHRIQIRRGVKGWRKPEGVVYVNRSTRFGNPFVVGTPGIPDAATAVQLHEAWMLNPDAPPMRINTRLISTPPPLEPIRGSVLACNCPLDQPCHADTLLRLANP